jgi:hypothetical protein
MKTQLKLVTEQEAARPSRRFLSLTRNPDLALNPPVRFEPTRKAAGDVVI